MSYTVAEYICPEHGKFNALVQRTGSCDPPDEHPCPALIAVVNMLDDGEAVDMVCDEPSPWTISGPLGRVKRGEVTQGKVSKAELPTWTDTEALGAGMSLREWKKNRAKVWKDHRYKTNVKDSRKGMA
jgi:hypothetical protein